jgi:hypothetical protein
MLKGYSYPSRRRKKQQKCIFPILATGQSTKNNIYTEFGKQKLEYIHNNPVDAGIVEKAEEYIYSSARDYYYGKQCGLIKIEFLL